MNRTDRLYALVEELRAVAPQRRSSRWLAERFEVSVRTIERDLSALQQAGVPIWATTGRNGGYAVDTSMTLPPLNFTASEALAMALAVARAGGSMPFAGAGRTALHKLLAAMSGDDAADVRDLAERIRLLTRDPDIDAEPIPPLIEKAVLDRAVIAIDYETRDGERSQREIEPISLVGSDHAWYLVAWCRLRDDRRSFRVDRIGEIRVTGETASVRPVLDDRSHFPPTTGLLPIEG